MYARKIMCTNAKKCVRTQNNVYARKIMCTHAEKSVRTQKMCTQVELYERKERKKSFTQKLI